MSFLFCFLRFLLVFIFRIALLLKGKCPGGMAPPFMSIGVDSDDESKTNIENSLKPVPIPTSVDSDDGKLVGSKITTKT